jgi:hypothetical protein
MLYCVGPSESQFQRQWDAYVKAGTNRREKNKVLMPLIWNELFQRPNEGALVAMHDWFGVSENTISTLLVIGMQLGQGGWEFTEHGMVDYRKTHKPMNTLAPDMVALIELHFEMKTRGGGGDAAPVSGCHAKYHHGYGQGIRQAEPRHLLSSDLCAEDRGVHEAAGHHSHDDLQRPQQVPTLQAL